MIDCTPRGICSWDFRLTGEGRQATLTYSWWTETGVIETDGQYLEIRKHGMMSGHWTLEQDWKPIVTAQKSNPFTRTFVLEDEQGTLRLYAQSPLGRSFLLERGNREIASLEPVHPFTRRATIDADTRDCRFVTLAFCFWLVALTWRRAAKNNS